jgi:hypothetical protein
MISRSFRLATSRFWMTLMLRMTCAIASICAGVKLKRAVGAHGRLKSVPA